MNSEVARKVLFESAPEPMWICGGETLKFLEINEAAVDIYGYTREEFLSMSLADISQPEDAFAGSIPAEGLQPWDVAGPQRHHVKSGHVIDVDLSLRPIEYEEGTAVLASARKITPSADTGDERAALQERERQTRVIEERFRILAKATNEVVWDWDIVSGTLWWSDGFEALFGYPLSEVEKGLASYSNRIHPEDRQRVMSGLQAVVNGGGTNWLNEYRCIGRDGKLVWVSERSFVIRDDGGAAVRVLGTMVDVSKRYETDERTRQSQKLEAIGQLTGGVAHDFNNLLTVILGNAELLSEELSREPKLHALAEMTVTAALRGAELTKRLLAFARRQALEPKVLQLNKLLSDMYEMLRRTLAEDIDIEILPGPDLWEADADPGQLEMAILNLAINARDAMPHGGRLTIETTNALVDADVVGAETGEENGQYVLVAVSDTGTGMPPEVVARAFEPFFTTKEIGKGSGLGLSMVYGFVKQSRGHIRVYSEMGEGTTVRLYLPRAQRGVGRNPEEAPIARALGGQEKILVVEDDPGVRDNLITQLKALGYTVFSAHNGPAALDLLTKNRSIQLLLTDVVMPGGMNGRQLADAARQLNPELRILFTSGYTENVITHGGRLDRGVHLLTKPYRRQDLAGKVRDVLDAA
jgi:PAS domain S-box-containing protein